MIDYTHSLQVTIMILAVAVIHGYLRTECGEVIKVGSSRWFAWLAENQSFRYESNDHAPYTVRKEKHGYWKGYKKVAGKVRSRGIGKTCRMTTERLEEIGLMLYTPSLACQAKVIDKVVATIEYAMTAKRLAELGLELNTDDDDEQADFIATATDTIADARISALEAQISELERELPELRSQLQKQLDLPEPADLLNRLKATRKRSKVGLADVEALLSYIRY